MAKIAVIVITVAVCAVMILASLSLTLGEGSTDLTSLLGVFNITGNPNSIRSKGCIPNPPVTIYYNRTNCPNIGKLGLNKNPTCVLDVKGDSCISESISIGKDVTIGGNAIIKNDVTIDGDVTIKKDVTIDGGVTINGALNVTNITGISLIPPALFTYNYQLRYLSTTSDEFLSPFTIGYSSTAPEPNVNTDPWVPYTRVTRTGVLQNMFVSIAAESSNGDTQITATVWIAEANTADPVSQGSIPIFSASPLTVTVPIGTFTHYFSNNVQSVFANIGAGDLMCVVIRSDDPDLALGHHQINVSFELLEILNSS